MNFWFVAPVLSETAPQTGIPESADFDSARRTRGGIANFGRVECYPPTGMIENIRVLSSYANSSA